MAKLVGSLTRAFKTEFYESPCEYKGAHREHLRSVMAGSGSGNIPMLIHGDQTNPALITHEYWCPGVGK